MQFSININQKAIYDLGLDISFEAAAVMDCMQKKTSISTFQKRAVKEGDKLYFEFTHSLIVDNLPIIFSNVKGSQKNKVIRLTDELENAKLIEKHPYPQKVKKSLYCFTELADKLIEHTVKIDKQLSPNRDSKTKQLSLNRDSDCNEIVTVNGNSLSLNRDISIVPLIKVENQEEYTPAPEKNDLDLIQPNQTAHVLPCEENDILKRQKEILLNQKREAEAVLSLKTKLSIWDSHSTLFDAIRKEYDDEIETQDVRDVKKQYQLQGMTFDLSHLENMLDTFCRKIITQEEQVNISLKVAKSRFFTSFIKNMSRFSPQTKKEEQKSSETLNYLILRNNLDKLLEQGTITEKDYKKQMNCFRDKIGATKTVTAEYFQTVLKSYAQ